MSKTFLQIFAATSVAATALIASAVPAAAHNWRRQPLQERCDGDGDRCALFRCDWDGDDCERVSPWMRREVYYDRRDDFYRHARYGDDDRYYGDRDDRRDDWRWREHELRRHCRDEGRD